MCNVSLATSESYVTDSGDKKESTEWHKLVIWGKQGETFEKYHSKGDLALVEGSIATRSWTNKDGQKQYSTEIKVHRWFFVGAKKQGNTAMDTEVAGSFDDADIPF